ncbi:SKN-1 Dependent Zygotic transcript [Caenorhabditis elegans]|uniref:SKN-1 Dependent Zygotic transcript n=1 Tax=Caenorhabditis elegans TaxID=6239 RepID=Q9XVB9_CAEEL|nr:SKN-1 Dependent Zygotic transcript [Caenorhabditis elegans]CAB03961.1 SKN-1 Dependent Zygotic transcript [Caenorhabditis elegans]|eukprot:NP_507764.1 SKN-1 Dependent Zygotic transcript [Caenorhabditis elegans]
MVYVNANVDTKVDNRKDNCDNTNTYSHTVDRKDNFDNTTTNTKTVNRNDNCNNQEEGDVNMYRRNDNCNNREATNSRSANYSIHNQGMINCYNGIAIDNRAFNSSGANTMAGTEFLRAFLDAPMSVMPGSRKNAIMDRQEGSTQPAIRYNNR